MMVLTKQLGEFFNIGNITAVNGDLTLEICPKQSLYNLATLTTPNSQDKTKGSDDMLDNAVTPPPFVCPLTLEIMRDPVLCLMGLHMNGMPLKIGFHGNKLFPQ